MKISQYQILLNDNQLPILMEERSHNYSVSENGLTNPMAFAEMLNSAFQAGKRAEEYVWVIALNIKCTPVAVLLFVKFLQGRFLQDSAYAVLLNLFLLTIIHPGIFYLLTQI